MKNSHQRLLRVRIDYEPNRYSNDCLKKIYEQLTPTTSREVKSATRRQQAEDEPLKTDEVQS